MSVDLSTRYLGFRLAHPIVASASPLTSSLDGLKRLQDAGVAEDLLEGRLKGCDIKQGLVHIADNDARHAARSLCGDGVSDSSRVRGAG